MSKENTAKEISNSNTNTTTMTSQNSISESSSNQAKELDKTEDLSMLTQQRKKTDALSKAVPIQRRKSVRNAKNGIHFDTNLDDPGETIHQKNNSHQSCHRYFYAQEPSKKRDEIKFG
eukprot:10935670-Ditylum_brightwellii.AAC.1